MKIDQTLMLSSACNVYERIFLNAFPKILNNASSEYLTKDSTSTFAAVYVVLLRLILPAQSLFLSRIRRRKRIARERMHTHIHTRVDGDDRRDGERQR